MAVDIFLKIGDIKGEAKDHAHKEEIDVLAWNWGMAQHGSGHVGGGSGSGKVSVQDLTFTKYLDKSTPDLMLSCCNGKHFPEAKLTVRKAGENPLEYLLITMNDVLITSLGTGGSGHEDRLTEHVTLNFAKVKVEYTEQTEKGAAGAKPKMGWDIEANKKL
jgi:type VI secretion system secreted protein Hcp